MSKKRKNRDNKEKDEFLGLTPKLQKLVKILNPNSQSELNGVECVRKIMHVVIHNRKCFDTQWAQKVNLNEALILLDDLYRIHYLQIPIEVLSKEFKHLQTLKFPELSLLMSQLVELMIPEGASEGGSFVNGISTRWLDESLTCIGVSSLDSAYSNLLWMLKQGTTRYKWQEKAQSVEDILENFFTLRCAILQTSGAAEFNLLDFFKFYDLILLKKYSPWFTQREGLYFQRQLDITKTPDDCRKDSRPSSKSVKKKPEHSTVERSI